MPARQYLLVGNGPAGWAAAEAIRQRDPRGQITILSHEGTAFYSRPGLAYLLTATKAPPSIPGPAWPTCSPGRSRRSSYSPVPMPTIEG